MDPRPGFADPLAAAESDLDALPLAPAQEHLAIYGRIHSALASALAGTAADPARNGPGPADPDRNGPGPADPDRNGPGQADTDRNGPGQQPGR